MTSKTIPSTAYFLIVFVAINLVATVLFAFVRIPFMTEKHFFRVTPSTSPPPAPASVSRVWDSFYHSVLTQTSIGCADVLPRSRVAQVIIGIQGLVTLLVFVLLGFWIVVACAAATTDLPARTATQSLY